MKGMKRSLTLDRRSSFFGGAGRALPVRGRMKTLWRSLLPASILIVGRRWSLRAPAAGLLLLLVASGASLKANNIAYMETSISTFGTIDLNTGAFFLIGPTAVQLSGLGVSGGTLYGVGSTGNLYQVNAANGNIALVGNSPHTYSDFGSTLSGVYGVDSATNVYSINPTNGAATLLGATGVTLTGANGLSTNSSTLYWADGPSLYTLNTSTGAATLVGNMGGPQLGAILLEGGILYGGEDSPNAQVVTLNTTTGVATAGSLLSGATGSFFGLAPDPLSSSTPEPGTWGLFAAGMIGITLMRRRTDPRRNAECQKPTYRR
jgi:hypothetical protein